MSHIVASSAPIASSHVVKQYAGFGILGADIPNTGDDGGSPVINDGINPTSEYYWRVDTSPTFGVLTIYRDLSFQITGLPNGVHTWVYRLFEDRIDQGTATVTVTVGGGIIVDLVINTSFHGQTVDNITLGTTGQISLIVQDTIHSQTSDNALLTTQLLLTVAKSIHSHSSTNQLLTTQLLLTIAKSIHAFLSDNLTLSTGATIILNVQDSAQQHSSDSLSFTLDVWLNIADSTHVTLVDNLSISGLLELVIADTLHNQSTDFQNLLVELTLSVADTEHVQFSQSLNLGTGITTVLTINEAIHNLFSNALTLSDGFPISNDVFITKKLYSVGVLIHTKMSAAEKQNSPIIVNITK